MKKIDILFSAEAEIVYQYIRKRANHSKQERMILDAINRKVDLIKQNAHYGKPVAKKLIPKEYALKYSATNLFRVELPLFWRMLYTLKDDEMKVEIIAFVIDIINHREYDKKFGYRKK